VKNCWLDAPSLAKNAIVTVAVIAAPAPTTKAAEFRRPLGMVARKMAEGGSEGRRS